MVNGDTLKQLLTRCRYILAKKPSKWTINQKQRADILFEQYPVLEEVCHHNMEFRNIYEDKTLLNAKERFECWITKSLDQQTKEFNTAHIQSKIT